MDVKVIGLLAAAIALALLFTTIATKQEVVAPVVEAPVVVEPVAPDRPSDPDTNTIIREKLGAP